MARAQSPLADLKARIQRELDQMPGPWPEGSPGISALVPSAFGGRRGTMGIGFGYQDRVRFSDRHSDGVFGVVVPVGDPVKSLGVDLVGTFLDLSDFGSRFGGDVKLHLRRKDSAIAIGYERALLIGTTDVDRSLYAVASHIVHTRSDRSALLSRLTLNLGFGNGRFRRESEVFRDRDRLGVFGSAAINLCPQASAFAEWTGQDSSLGLSLLPFASEPLIVTLAATDLSGTAGDGRRFSFGVGYGIRF